MTDTLYNIVVVPDAEDGGYYAFMPDLQGCMGDGDTPQDAVADVISAAKCWADVRAEQGREMPEPGVAERAFEEQMKERDDHISKLESEVADLKAKLRIAERAAMKGRIGTFTKSRRGFVAA